MYWIEEGGVSTVYRDNLTSPTSDVDIGSLCNVKLGKKVYPGEIAACGKYSPSVSVLS